VSKVLAMQPIANDVLRTNRNKAKSCPTGKGETAMAVIWVWQDAGVEMADERQERGT